MALLPSILALQAAALPHLLASRTAVPPALDGRLDETAWQRTAGSDAFTQKVPDEGKPPVERTVVRVLYDDHAVYIGVVCEQTGAPVIARLTRRDRLVEADSVTVGLDTRGDGKSAFEFTVNAAGVLADGIYTNDTSFSRDWDENWDARTAITDRGWSVEIRIPLHALRYESKPVQSWGLQVSRYVSARQETDEWSFAPKGRPGWVSLYGRLDGITGLRAPSYVEVSPFVTGRVRRLDVAPGEGDPGPLLGASAGLDLRWHVTPQLTLNATANPDFGQVEADPAVLNLGTFETFYPEKRAFFLEGADTFSTPLDLVYTRRIGRAPSAPELRDDETQVADPEPSTIYGAAKLVGDLGDRVSIGQLVAITGRERVEARRGDGSRVLRVADPLTSYKVLRLKGDVGGGAQLGVIATATNRYEPAGEYPMLPAPSGGPRLQLCPGGEEVRFGDRCFHDAYVGGVDARWRSPSGDYVVIGQLVGTLIEDGPARTMPDGTVIADGDTSPAGVLVATKEGGNWRGELSYVGRGRRVDFNDLGYMQRQNQHSFFAGVRYVTLAPWWETRETDTGLGVFERDTLDFLNLERVVFANTTWKLKSFWEAFFEVYAVGGYYEDREVGDGTALERAGISGAAARVTTDPRERVQGEVYSFVDLLLSGGLGWKVEGVATFKVLPQLDISLAPSYFSTDGETRYFETENSNYLFGALRAQSFGLTLRSTYTFTPRLTLEAYAQAFLASEAYTDYAAFPVAAGQRPRIELRDLGPAPAVVETNPDYESASFNANLVLRWEYRVGSTLYVVYTHGQSDTDVPGQRGTAGLRLRLLDPRLASDVLLAKLSYWWG